MSLINTGDNSICVTHANLVVNNGSGENNIWRCQTDSDADYYINGLALECVSPRV